MDSIKYAFRDSHANMDLSEDQAKAIVVDCLKSIEHETFEDQGF